MHDFNGGIQPSGLFWIALELSHDQLHISRDQRHVSVRASHVPVIDTGVIGGSVSVPASVSWSMEWHARGPFAPLGSGKSVKPEDPAAFTGKFAPADAFGSFSGQELGFTFRSNPGVSTARGYAEVGTETNGSFLS